MTWLLVALSPSSLSNLHTHIPVSEICAGGRRHSSKSNRAAYWLEGIMREVTAESAADTKTYQFSSATMYSDCFTKTEGI